MPLHDACFQAERSLIAKPVEITRLRKLFPMQSALARMHAYARSIANGGKVPADLDRSRDGSQVT